MKKMILTFLAVLILSVGAAAAAPQYHTVARGETLFGLAQRYGAVSYTHLRSSLALSGLYS